MLRPKSRMLRKPAETSCGALIGQKIDENGPGSILADFEVLLRFLEPGVRSTGKHHLLPMARLYELDEMMTTPLRPRLQRPQQRSFPHLNGLYLLLQATHLGLPAGEGKTSGQLKLDSGMHEQWLQLNATERYFNLLEAWLRKGSWDPTDYRNSRWMSRASQLAHDLFDRIPPEGRRFSQKEQKQGSLFYSVEQYGTLALLELFGIMVVERGEPDEGQGWRIVEVRHTPFGDQLMGIVFGEVIEQMLNDKTTDVEFGAWQSTLQPFFPEWVNNLSFPGPEFRDGTWYFKVSLGKVWRRIAIPAQFDLDDLAGCIIGAFDFDGDHLYAFELLSRHGCQMRIEHPCVSDAEMLTDDVPIGELPLGEGQSMVFHYDFGADWRFSVLLEEIKPAGGKISEPTIVASRGKAPPEYDFDDGW